MEAGNAETTRANAVHGLEELRAGLLRIERETALLRDEERRRLLAELADNRLRQSYLSGNIEQAEYCSMRQQITSPVKGHVAQLMFHTVGGVVTPAERLAVIVPRYTEPSQELVLLFMRLKLKLPPQQKPELLDNRPAIPAVALVL